MNGIIDAVVLAYLIVNMSVDSKKYVSNLKLQKLLYFIQVEHIKTYGKPLFENKIEAWKYGPVIPSVYREFSKFGGGLIDQKISHEIYRKKDDIILVEKIMIDDSKKLNLNDEVINLIKNQIKEHADNNPWDLVELSHRHGGAWEAKHVAGENVEITIDDIIENEITTNHRS